MKITGIKPQITNPDRYSIFIDGRYKLSLNSASLLAAQLVVGQVIDGKRLKQLERLSSDDKLSQQALNFVANRPKSQWEVEAYLKRKGASPALTATILNKLSNIGLIDDTAYAQALVRHRTSLKPTSRRKLMNELKQKHVPETVARVELDEYSAEAERAALLKLVKQKRRIAKYKDDLKLMQYLARQGFNYEDIKLAVKNQ